MSLDGLVIYCTLEFLWQGQAERTASKAKL